MKILRFLALLLPFIFTAGFSPGQGVPEKEMPAHPRLLWLSGEEAEVRQNIQTDKNWQKIHEAIIAEANAIIPLPTLERIQIGRRLLDKSREALRRMLFLSYAYRMTSEKKFAERAEAELVKVSKFSDWNPTHFLDVAEMTLAVSLGYDWLHDQLNEAAKQTIRTAIIEKGINPSYDSKYNWFLQASHNWNQVCNAGMTFGALAVYEHEPELAKKTITRAVESIKLPMEDYKPSGAYPEGFGYWIYGTSFNVFFLNAIEKIYGTNFGLTEAPGFLATGGYAQHVMGATKYSFNYSDSGTKKEQLNPTLFWFANRTNSPSLIYGKDNLVATGEINVKDRIFPMIMIWGKDLSMNGIPEPKELFWEGDGKNPVAFMRSGWSEKDIYVGFKGGAPEVNHGHMDIGSFILDAAGERWAVDLGSQGYESLESKGIKLWDKAQNGQRWEILRYNNRYHNTLAFDNELQLVEGDADIIHKSDNEDNMFAIADLTQVYINKVKDVKRGIALQNRSVVVVQDEVKTGASTTLRWSMLTPAKVEKMQDDEIVLTQNGKKLYLKIKSSGTPINLKTWSAEPVNTYDAPNPGITIVGFESALPANTEHTFKVMISENDKSPESSFTKLDDWK